MRKLFHMTLIILILIPMLVVPEEAKAKTLGELRKELSDLENKYNQSQQEEEETKNKMDATEKRIQEIEKSVQKMEEEIVNLNKEIIDLKKKIEEKNIEIKKIINFTQRSNGESAYLEYAFGAKNFTDFIYRVAVTEQLTRYNDALIEEFETLIDQNNQKEKELELKKEQLKKEKEKQKEELSKLGARLGEISMIKMGAAEELQLQREAISILENLGCKDHEDIKTCGRDVLPSDTALWRPIQNGYVVSEYGYRLNPATLVYELHEALDVSQSGYVPIYSAANGTVIGMRHQSSCGGNMVFILHTINGVKYTTEYAHLREIHVSIGQVVTKNTQIGVMGGDPSREYWDRCSTGQHLHFGIAKGHYLKDYYNWYTFIANTFDPREVVNFPWTGGATDYFQDRITKY